MSLDFLMLALVGFCAQMIDGALGMAFGVISTSAMLSLGLPPAHASAVAHTAEIFTTAASGTSHVYFRNVDWRLVIRLGIAGVVGAVIGAWVLSNIDGNLARPFVAAYLFIIGVLILIKSVRRAPERDPDFRISLPLGLVGGFLDASGVPHPRRRQRRAPGRDHGLGLAQSGRRQRAEGRLRRPQGGRRGRGAARAPHLPGGVAARPRQRRAWPHQP
jgi:hypothetical protein